MRSGVEGIPWKHGPPARDTSARAVAPIHFHDMMPGSVDGPCQASAVAPGAFDLPWCTTPLRAESLP